MALLLMFYGTAMIATTRRVKEPIIQALKLAENLRVEIGERRLRKRP